MNERPVDKMLTDFQCGLSVESIAARYKTSVSVVRRKLGLGKSKSSAPKRSAMACEICGQHKQRSAYFPDGVHNGYSYGRMICFSCSTEWKFDKGGAIVKRTRTLSRSSGK